MSLIVLFDEIANPQRDVNTRAAMRRVAGRPGELLAFAFLGIVPCRAGTRAVRTLRELDLRMAIGGQTQHNPVGTSKPAENQQRY